MKEIIAALNGIEKEAKSSGDGSKTLAAIKAAQATVASSKDPALKQLLEELNTWQTKFQVIWKEPVARQGMVKHIHHWVDQLNQTADRSSAPGAKNK